MVVNREEESRRAEACAEDARKRAKNTPSDVNKEEAERLTQIAAKKTDAYLRLCPGTHWQQRSIGNKL